jgi:hypothetical protein
MAPLKLVIAIRMVALFVHLPGTLQTIALAPQKDAYRVGTNGVTHGLQFRRQLDENFGRPTEGIFWIPPRRGGDEAI